MSGDQIGELAYLVILGAAVVVWYVTSNRMSLGKVAQQAIAWVLIFVAAIAAVGVWDDIRSTVAPRQSVHGDSGQITVPRSPDGHYYLTLDVNGQPIVFLVDTGATQMVLNESDAVAAGLDPAQMIYSGTAYTANGVVRTAPVRLDEVRLGPHLDRRVSAWVNGGDLDQSLLGMSYLQRWSSIEIRNGALVLTR
jgi:aspartyl protease family protein